MDYYLFMPPAGGMLNVLLTYICLDQTEGIFRAVPVASLITMGSIHTRPDESMADIISCAECSLHIRAIVWIHIYCKTNLIFLCKLHQTAYDLVIIRTAAVLCTNRNFPLCTHKAFAYTAHIHRPCFCNTSWYRGASAVSHFLIHRKMSVYKPLRLYIFFF